MKTHTDGKTDRAIAALYQARWAEVCRDGINITIAGKVGRRLAAAIPEAERRKVVRELVALDYEIAPAQARRVLRALTFVVPS